MTIKYDSDFINKSAMGKLPIDFDPMKHLAVGVRGVIFFIDIEDYNYFSAHSWYTLNEYLVYSKEGKPFFYHREVTNTPDHLLCDHKNKKKNDNRKLNLRHCTYAENSANHKSKDKIKGVTFKCNKYYAYYHLKRIRTHIGVFNSIEEAAREHDKKVIELYGEFATTNYPLSEYKIPKIALCKTFENPSRNSVITKQTGRYKGQKDKCALCEKKETVGLLCREHNIKLGYFLRTKRVDSREEFILKYNDLPSINKSGSTGIVGVQYYKKRDKYRAVINKNKRRIIVGLFDSVEEAIDARNNYLENNEIQPIVPKTESKTCSLCEKFVFFSGLCQQHYTQQRRKITAEKNGKEYIPNEKKRNKIARAKYPI